MAALATLVALSALASAQDITGTTNAMRLSNLPCAAGPMLAQGADQPGARDVHLNVMGTYALQPLSLYSPDGSREALLDHVAGVTLSGCGGLTDRVSVALGAPLWASFGEGDTGPALGDVRAAAPILLRPAREDSPWGLALIPHLSVSTPLAARYLTDGAADRFSIAAVGLTAASRAERGAWDFTAALGVDVIGQDQPLNLEGGPGVSTSASSYREVREDRLAVGLEAAVRVPVGSHEARWTETTPEVLLGARGRTDTGVGWAAGAGVGAVPGAGASPRAQLSVNWGSGRSGDALEPAELLVLVQDPDGAPISEAQVRLDQTEVRTGTGGMVRFDDLAPSSTPSLAVDADGYEAEVRPAIALAPGLNEQIVVLDPETGSVRVLAFDQRGEPVDGRVRFLDGPRDHPTEALGEDGEGVWDVTPGTWRLLVSNPAYAPIDAEVTLAAGDRRTVEVRFQDARPDIREPLMGDVLFDWDSDALRPEALPILKRTANTMLDTPEYRLIEVQGHTDRSGSVGYNDDLSDRRAERVRSTLVGYGVDAERLTARGYGESTPAVQTADGVKLAENRRVEFHILIADEETPVANR